jgi:putative GTP pyrophosphokinase
MDDNAIEIGKDPGVETVLLDGTNFSDVLEEFKDVAAQFEVLMMMYSSAIREVRTKLEVLNDEFKVRRSHNPIEYIKYRVKKPQSILEKLHRRGFPVSLASIEENLHDVAGIRVVCGYVQDIYMVADMLVSQADIRLLQVKDYIAHPKENGYRSLHLVVEIPVFFSNECKPMKVEVQFRTIAMDNWASLEHQMHYKTDGEVPADIIQALKECSDALAATDLRMQSIYNTLGLNIENQT